MEDNGNRASANVKGVYVHAGSGARLEAQNEPQADALVHMGYELEVTEPEAEEKSEEPKAKKGKE